MDGSNSPIKIDEKIFACKTLKNMPYTPSVAIAELIDNASVAIQNQKRNIPTLNGVIEIRYDALNSKLTISDNGIGFSSDTRKNTILYGTSCPGEGRNRYNVGMKNAIFWLGNEYHIYSFDTIEQQAYETSVKLDIERVDAVVSEWAICEKNDQIGVYSTVVEISKVRQLSSNYNIFQKTISTPIKEIFRKDLENNKYCLSFVYVTHTNEEITDSNVRPYNIQYQTGKGNSIFLKTKDIVVPGYPDVFHAKFRIMSPKSEHRMSFSGFHFYYKDRKIISYSVLDVTGDNTNIFKRLYVQIDIDNNNTELSFLKDGISVDEQVQSTLFFELKDFFRREIKDFLIDLSESEKRARSEKVSDKPGKKGNSEVKNALVPISDIYIVSLEGEDYVFQTFVDPEYRDAMKVEYMNQTFSVFIRSDIIEEDSLKAIFYAILSRHYPDLSLSSLFEYGEIK